MVHFLKVFLIINTDLHSFLSELISIKMLTLYYKIIKIINQVGINVIIKLTNVNMDMLVVILQMIKYNYKKKERNLNVKISTYMNSNPINLELYSKYWYLFQFLLCYL